LARLNKNTNSQKPKNEAVTGISTDLTAAAPISGIFAVGLVLAILVLLLEFAIHKMKISSKKISTISK
jgi:hypothetical protein